MKSACSAKSVTKHGQLFLRSGFPQSIQQYCHGAWAVEGCVCGGAGG